MSLKEKLAALAKVSSNAQATAPSKAFAFIGVPADQEYLQLLKPYFLGARCYYVTDKQFQFLNHLDIFCGKHNITAIASTCPQLLTLALGRSWKGYSNYEGSLFKLALPSGRIVEIVFIPPLPQLFTVTYGKFLTKTYISKIISPETWAEPSKFSWSLLEPTNATEFLAQLSSPQAVFLAVDIETLRNPLSIRCVGFSLVLLEHGSTDTYKTVSVVLPITSVEALYILRQICFHPIIKCFQNGKYDCTYLLRYNSAPASYLYDTKNLMHCIYAELPKDLAFLNALFLRDVIYWKDMAETNDLFKYYEYCAMDTWATANVWIAQVAFAPAYAMHNYVLQFPMVNACLLSEMTGLIRDTDRLRVEASKAEAAMEVELGKLRRMIGQPHFNPSSPPQCKTLLKILGIPDAKSSDEKSIAAASFKHPLNDRILSPILTYRGDRKLVSTYLTYGEDAKEFCGTILYSINPDGTDTGRNSSREHAFWCGLQIQNIPGQSGVKNTLRAPDDFIIAECDLEQAETRDTAHIAGDEDLIAACTGTKDFHSLNASAFFGVPYEAIYDAAKGKTLDKPLRDLAKRVNHGANYNMGKAVLVATMGLKKIYEAARMLKLSYTDPLDIAEYLLASFHRTYKNISGAYYPWIKHEIAVKSMLVSRAFHHTPYNLASIAADGNLWESRQEAIESVITTQGDWTRYCFGDPSKSKPALNAYIAHAPQSLNARTLNEAFLRVYKEVALPNPTTFRLYAQIHDSILFAFHKDHAYLADQVKDLMEIPVTVRDVSGHFRTFTVPAALKISSSSYWGDCP
jgi:DNA polymerase I-like protein with 3'-5' exonuclease and polymerase domains